MGSIFLRAQVRFPLGVYDTSTDATVYQFDYLLTFIDFVVISSQEFRQKDTMVQMVEPRVDEKHFLLQSIPNNNHHPGEKERSKIQSKKEYILSINELLIVVLFQIY